MPSSLIDVCRFSPTAGGTTDWTYSAAVTGYQSPSAAGVINGATYSYRAESADLTQWEVGTGTYNTGTGVLARTAVLYNSSGTTSKINFSAVPQVAIVALGRDVVIATSAVLQVSPSNPTGTSSLSGAMMGLGSTCTITPLRGTRVRVEFRGATSNTVTGAANSCNVRYGTGTAPTNGASLTGTVIGSTIPAANTANYQTPFSAGGIITGLTVGTAYWFDVGLAPQSAGTATILNLSCDAFEVS